MSQILESIVNELRSLTILLPVIIIVGFAFLVAAIVISIILLARKAAQMPPKRVLKKLVFIFSILGVVLFVVPLTCIFANLFSGPNGSKNARSMFNVFFNKTTLDDDESGFIYVSYNFSIVPELTPGNINLSGRPVATTLVYPNGDELTLYSYMGDCGEEVLVSEDCKKVFAQNTSKFFITEYYKYESKNFGVIYRIENGDRTGKAIKPGFDSEDYYRFDYIAENYAPVEFEVGDDYKVYEICESSEDELYCRSVCFIGVSGDMVIIDPVMSGDKLTGKECPSDLAKDILKALK